MLMFNVDRSTGLDGADFDSVMKEMSIHSAKNLVSHYNILDRLITQSHIKAKNIVM